MTRILFVCLGNICRSPMAEFICRDMARRRGLDGLIVCESAGTSDEEEGNPVYPPAMRVLRAMGIDAGDKRARPLTPGDYARFDRLIGMEKRHVRAMQRLFGGDPEGKLSRLLDGAPRPRDIADPWYTGDFETAKRDIIEGCGLLLDRLAAEDAAQR